MPVRVQTLRSSVKLQRPAAGSREPGELYVSFPDKQFGVIDAAKVPLDLLAIRFFSTTTDYAGGDFVINGGVGYKAKGPVSAGTFNPVQWDTLATSIDLSGKEDAIAAGTTSQYWRGDKSWQTLDKAAVGLDQVNNTSDANKPVSTAQAASDNARVLKAGDVMSGHLGLPTGPAATEAVRKDYVDAAIPTWTTLSGKPATFPPTLPIASSGITGLDTKQASQDAAIAAITSFPEAPTDGKTYGRKDAAWSAVVGGARISDTPPAGPQNGEQWWKSSTGDMFIWYDDGDSQQWVQVNAAPANMPPVPPSDGGEYTMVNGIWRLKAQTFKPVGANAIVPIPATAKLAKINAELWLSITAGGAMRWSLDGTTFAAGAGDYTYSGQAMYGGSGANVKLAATNLSYVPLSGTHDFIAAPMHVQALLGVAKATATSASYFALQSRGTAFGSGAAFHSTEYLIWTHNQTALAGATQMAAFQIYPTAGTLVAGTIIEVEWIY